MNNNLTKGDLIIYEDELNRNSTVANFATVQIEGKRKVSRNIDYYNLDLIIAVRISNKFKKSDEI